jgi:hypothetical protein
MLALVLEVAAFASVGGRRVVYPPSRFRWGVDGGKSRSAPRSPRVVRWQTGLRVGHGALGKAISASQ